MPIRKWFELWRLVLQQRKEKRKFSFTMDDPSTLQLIKSKTREEIADTNIKNLPENSYSAESSQSWRKLSRRERDVTALTCLAYTNYQIAARLGLSIETVRTYLRNALGKLNLRNKADLRVHFAEWDFSEWERRKDPDR